MNFLIARFATHIPIRLTKDLSVHSTYSKNSLGFTLIEVLISIAILAVISIYTATSIQQSIKSKKRYETEIDRRSQLRSALELITRDVNLAFNHRDIGAELYNLAWESRIKEAEAKERGGSGGKDDGGAVEEDENPPENPPPNDNPATGKLSERLKQKFKKKEIRIFTHFLGSGERLDFTSRSYLRTMADAKSSDQIEVGYFLRDCKNRMNQKETSKCLVRRVSNLLDGKVDEGGVETVLLENVLQFVLRYTGEGYDDEWTDVWKTGDQATDARTKSNFPYAVEITLGIKEPEKPESKGLSMTVVAQLRFPNNPSPDTTNANEQTAVPNNGVPQ